MAKFSEKIKANREKESARDSNPGIEIDELNSESARLQAEINKPGIKPGLRAHYQRRLSHANQRINVLNNPAPVLTGPQRAAAARSS